MLNINFNFLNKELDIMPIRTLFVEGESFADMINITMPKTYNNIDLSTKIFVIKMLNSKNAYYEAILPKVVNADSLSLSWDVTKEFTSEAGNLRVNLIAKDDAGFTFSSKEAVLEIQSSVDASGIPLSPEDVFEQYLQEMRLLEDLAIESSTQAVAAKTEALASKLAAEAAKTAAEAARDAAALSQADALTSKSAAETARTGAEAARDEAVAARDAAEIARDEAVPASVTATTARDEAVAAADEVERDRAEVAANKADFESKIVDNLSSTDPKEILSANQGRVLDGRINNIVGYTGTSTVEVVDARYSSVTGVTSPNLTARINSAETNIKELQNTTGIYGIRWNETDDIWTRLGQSTVLTDFSKAYPFGNVRRCNLDDTGKVKAYYGDPTFTEDGTNGQVMVEYPKTYSKYLYYTVSGKTYHEWWVSRVQYADFEINPAFIKGTGTIDKFYLGAYNGSIFDTSASAYLLADEQVADFTASTGDKLSSISGAKPCSGLTQDLNIVKSRILANNRGANWGLWNGNQVAFVQMLLMIEYGHANSQTAIGLGVVSKTDDGLTNMANVNGATSFLGNLSGRQAGTDGLTSVSYRGLENMWGNIYSWVDGINITANNLWINPTNQNFQSNLFASPYVLQGTLLNTSGYVSKLLGTKYGMFATQNTGSSTTRIPDYYYQSSGTCIAPLGGTWDNSSAAGFACWILDGSSVSRFRYFGARLCCF